MQILKYLDFKINGLRLFQNKRFIYFLIFFFNLKIMLWSNKGTYKKEGERQKLYLNEYRLRSVFSPFRFTICHKINDSSFKNVEQDNRHHSFL